MNTFKIFTVILVVLSSLSCSITKISERSKKILPIEIQDRFFNDTLRIYNNGCQIFDKIISNKGTFGYTGDKIIIFREGKDRLLFKVYGNFTYINEEERFLNILCKSENLNLEIYLNDKKVLHVNSPQKLYLGILKSNSEIYLTWSDTEFFYD